MDWPDESNPKRRAIVDHARAYELMIRRYEDAGDVAALAEIACRLVQLKCLADLATAANRAAGGKARGISDEALLGLAKRFVETEASATVVAEALVDEPGPLFDRSPGYVARRLRPVLRKARCRLLSKRQRAV